MIGLFYTQMDKLLRMKIHHLHSNAHLYNSLKKFPGNSLFSSRISCTLLNKFKRFLLIRVQSISIYAICL